MKIPAHALWRQARGGANKPGAIQGNLPEISGLELIPAASLHIVLWQFFHKKLLTQVFFKRRDLPRKSWLGDMEQPCGAGEASCLNDRQKAL